jgi:HlyD family secretion protein
MISGAEADVKLSQSEMDRAKELFQKNLISEAELDIAEAQYDKALSQLEQAQASLTEAEDALSKTILKAPLSGIIIRKNKDAGEMALGSQFQSDVILGLADLSKMEARVEVNENDIINVSLADTCEVEIDAFRDTTFIGLVSEISHSATTKSAGTIEEVTNYDVHILLLDKVPSFRPGMSATADIRTQTVENALNVPIQSLTAREREKLMESSKVESTPAERESEAVLADQKKKNKRTDEMVEVVFVVDGGIAHMRQIEIGISDENYYEVINGLQEGDEVVTGPFKVLSRELDDEDEVKVKPSTNELTKEK